MTSEEDKLLLDHWSLKPRGKDGKRPRPANPILTPEELKDLPRSPAERKTKAQVIAAQQAQK